MDHLLISQNHCDRKFSSGVLPPGCWVQREGLCAEVNKPLGYSNWLPPPSSCSPSFSKIHSVKTEIVLRIRFIVAARHTDVNDDLCWIGEAERGVGGGLKTSQIRLHNATPAHSHFYIYVGRVDARIATHVRWSLFSPCDFQAREEFFFVTHCSECINARRNCSFGKGVCGHLNPMCPVILQTVKSPTRICRCVKHTKIFFGWPKQTSLDLRSCRVRFGNASQT